MQNFLQSAREAALAAGGLLRAHFGKELRVDTNEKYDIKLELDRRSQALIEVLLLEQNPEHGIYGEEGIRGNSSSPYQWIVDPIDGTVNFFYGFPHFGISIALRKHDEILVGVIYDPIRDELWEVEKGSPPCLNGLPISVSKRNQLSEAFISVGVSKSPESIDRAMPVFEKMVRSAKKCRLTGSASLDIAYVACGRLDAYMENQISLWDIAAGILLVEAAGGKVDLRPHATLPEKYSIVASSGLIPL
ncbi:MAG: inositol monophosphatase [Verrucomicrobia bacterium]|nr:MAG: inositol monophosphatase [Verrucomicrobiota bacterium]